MQYSGIKRKKGYFNFNDNDKKKKDVRYKRKKKKVIFNALLTARRLLRKLKRKNKLQYKQKKLEQKNIKQAPISLPWFYKHPKKKIRPVQVPPKASQVRINKLLVYYFARGIYFQYHANRLTLRLIKKFRLTLNDIKVNIIINT